LILNKIAGKNTRMTNFQLVLEIFSNLFGVCLGKKPFFSKQNYQNRSKGVFAK
jgi:hypothetical protein